MACTSSVHRKRSLAYYQCKMTATRPVGSAGQAVDHAAKPKPERKEGASSLRLAAFGFLVDHLEANTSARADEHPTDGFEGKPGHVLLFELGYLVDVLHADLAGNLLPRLARPLIKAGSKLQKVG
eukprot:CAMPEP_0181206424 /NCGR_PEP_ID=MMETSP1096-20121128/21027_1 /TAXON_ID=156174 ORGANISM="Chrysochromulina ericina, Strain CCMP281" /NCGR_SAMPLE_ID=MMETSP1096 /ASSEMBLY_ACC=CAM_ASM_000453 /LENGTH=124 /DNA_ID=CAMNT_0023297321 /DNA_START=456 /DNA_END=831 /DNA_ORIENTATION=-